MWLRDVPLANEALRSDSGISISIAATTSSTSSRSFNAYPDTAKLLRISISVNTDFPTAFGFNRTFRSFQ